MLTDEDLRVILDNLSMPVLALDKRLHVVFLNPAAEELLGISQRRAYGRHFNDCLPLEQAIGEHLQASLDSEVVRNEREIGLAIHPERSSVIDLTITPLTHERHHTQAIALLLEIIPLDSRQHHHEEMLRQQQHQLSRMLARGLAHEIRNPLGGLRGAAQLLARETSDRDLREYTDIIISEADRLTALVDRLLGPQTGPKQRPTNIHRPIEHVHSLIRAEGHEKLHIETDYDPSLPDIRIDPDQFVQAMLNIALNAVQAMQGQGTLIIRTRSQRQTMIGDQYHRLVARIDIIDDGPGIPADIAGNIFLPMISGRANGSGLGLPIAQSLIQQNGGIIECQSDNGSTTFSIFLPLNDHDD